MSSTNRGGTRRANDDYQTPPWAVRALLQRVTPSGAVLEPCRGSGNISRTLMADPRCRERIGQIDWCEIDYAMDERRDFLQEGPWARRSWDWIVTNPPYTLLQPFIDRSLWLAKHTAMLLRLNCLESEERREWWQTRTPSAIFVLSQRPHFLDREGNRVLGKDGRPGSDSCAYGWFVWSRLYQGIHVIGPTPEDVEAKRRRRG